MADDNAPPVVPAETPTETPAPVVENPVPEPTPSVEQPILNEQTPPVVETPTPAPEPTPVVTPEPPPVVDVPVPNFRFPFNGDFPMTFPFNAQATTDEMKAKFAQWGISGHHGIDFGLPEGTEVLAVDVGKILQSSENSDYGISVTIQHLWGQSLYAHLKETKVSEDQEVKAGDLIGLSGQTGAAFGPHLHFGIKPNNPNETNGYLGFIDPTQYLPTVSQTPNIPNPPNPPNPPDNPIVEPEKPKEETVPVPQPQPEPAPEPSINIEPVTLPTEEKPQQPESPLPAAASAQAGKIPQTDETEIQKQVDEKLNAELEARRLKANEARKENRQEHLAAIEKLVSEKKEITSQDVQNLVHVSRTTAFDYLTTLINSGRIKVEGKGKATVYKNMFS